MSPLLTSNVAVELKGHLRWLARAAIEPLSIDGNLYSDGVHHVLSFHKASNLYLVEEDACSLDTFSNVVVV